MPSIDFSGKVKSSFTRRLAISGRDYARKLRAGLDEQIMKACRVT
jgi:hypothetical protein